MQISQLPAYQLGDSSTTLGLIFAVVRERLLRGRVLEGMRVETARLACACERAWPACGRQQLRPTRPPTRPSTRPQVGFGCFVGPVALNHLFPPRPPALRWGVAASYGLFGGGLALMLVAPGIVLLLASTFIRSMGGW